jgi:hypothetical protein
LILDLRRSPAMNLRGCGLLWLHRAGTDVEANDDVQLTITARQREVLTHRMTPQYCVPHIYWVVSKAKVA